MDNFRGHHESDLQLTKDIEISGMVSGTVTVPPGVYLLLSGMITGDLIVQNAARAVVRGMVIGVVLNQGADVEIFGTVGSVRDLGAKKTTIAAHAVIRNSN